MNQNFTTPRYTRKAIAAPLAMGTNGELGEGSSNR